MTQPVLLIYTDNPGALPANHLLPDGTDVEIQSVVARIDGAGAAGAFYPTLAIYSQSGLLMARVRADTLYSAGDTGVVTWSPFLRSVPPPATGVNDFERASVYDLSSATIPDSTLTEVTAWSASSRHGFGTFVDIVTGPPKRVAVVASTLLALTFYAPWTTSYAGARRLEIDILGAGNSLFPGQGTPLREAQPSPSQYNQFTILAYASVTTSPAQLTVSAFQTSGTNKDVDNLAAFQVVALTPVTI